MSKPVCKKCLFVRAVVLAALLGGGGGYLVSYLGAGKQLSMLATFAGAIVPLMWYARKTRSRR